MDSPGKNTGVGRLTLLQGVVTFWYCKVQGQIWASGMAGSRGSEVALRPPSLLLSALLSS